MEIRKAGPDEAGVVSSILIEAALWLEEKKMPSWNVSDLQEASVLSEMKSVEYYLLFNEGVAVACFRYQESDQEYWGDVPHDDSHFVHRVAVRREFSGRGIVKLLLDFAKQKAKNSGMRFLKLDCIDRPRLRSVYEREGFEFHSVKERSPYNVIRYEYLLGDSVKS